MTRSSRKTFTFAAAALAAITLAGCAGYGSGGGGGGGGPTVAIVNGAATRLSDFDVVGQADWAIVDGAVQATKGGATPSYLVTKKSYKDVYLRGEFWASDDANSGFFMRCQDPKVITDENCYEANIFDQRPDPMHSTGAIVKVAAVRQPPPKAGGKWNVMEVTTRGDHLVVVLNGEKTVDVRDRKLAQGVIALQWGRGTIKFRKVEVREL